MNNFEEMANETCLKEKMIGMACLYTDKDKIINSFTYGKSNLEKDKKMSLDTIYRIASVSKIIVALGIMKLVEEGKLDIHEDISKYLGYLVRNPHYPNKIITLEMIMTQTSSLSDTGENTCGYDYVNGPIIEVKLQDLLVNPNCLYYTPKTFANNVPGSTWEYSNLGCGVLACIIEKVSGMYYNDYLKEHIFKPLNLDASFRVDEIKNQDLITSLYVYDNNQFKLCKDRKQFMDSLYPKYELGNNFRGPAGGLFICPKDLSKIMLMLINKGTYQGIKLYESSTIELMKEIHWQGVAKDDEIYQKKGLQLLIIDFISKDPLYGHFGNAYGAYTMMLFNDKGGYIAMTNGMKYVKGEDKMSTFQSNILHNMLKMTKQER